MKTQEQFAEEILDQCMNGTSVSNLMAVLEEYRIQLASQLEPPVIVKTAEEIKQAKLEVLKEIKIEVAQKQQKIFDSRMPYVKDECWEIVEDIDSDIKLLEGIIRGLTFKIDELEK